MQSRVQCVLPNRLWTSEHLCGGTDFFLSAPAESEQLMQELDNSNCSLCFRFITVWGKRRNLAYLLGCCTIDSTSISLRFSSLDLIFSGSWQLKVHWARFLLGFRSHQCNFGKLCDCKSEWINTQLMGNSRLLTSFCFLCTCKQSPPFLMGQDSLLIHHIVGKHCQEEQRALKF